MTLHLGFVYFNEMEFAAVAYKIKGIGVDHLQGLDSDRCFGQANCGQHEEPSGMDWGLWGGHMFPVSKDVQVETGGKEFVYLGQGIV